jgi:HK97 family phage major capsid protein
MLKEEHAMDMATLVRSAESELTKAKDFRASARTEIDAIIKLVEQQGRTNLTAEEDTRTEELLGEIEQRDGEIAALDQKVGRLQAAVAVDAQQDAALNERSATGATLPAYDKVARVGTEERTYRRDTDRKGAQFLRDVATQFLFRNQESEQRLSRHMQEERVENGKYLERAAGTGAFSGLVVPQYLTDMYAPATAALRPFADVCNPHELPPSGMTINISRITTPSSVANQSSENTAVSETNLDDTLLTENVLTAAGQQTLSRQAIDRGTGIEDVTMDDLFRRYATNLDGQLITTASVGLSAVASPTTYTDTTPTGAELYPKILGAVSGVESALLNFGMATHAVMHSRRWHWLSSQLTSQWPMINQPGLPVQQSGVNTGQPYGGVRGTLPNGLSVVVDNNIATNLGGGTEDEIYVVPFNECHLWEDPQAPVFIRAEQPAAASLGVLLVLYGYFAFSFRRYTNGMGKISGSGLAAPTF